MNIDIHKSADLFKIKVRIFGNEAFSLLGRDKMAPLMLQS